MTKTLAVFLLCIAFLGCRREPELKPQSQLTLNQKTIIRDYNSIEKYLNKSPDSLRKLVDGIAARVTSEPPFYRAMAQIALATKNANQSRYQIAFKHYENAFKLSKLAKSDSLRARSVSGIGTYYSNIGDYPKALEHLLKALEIHERTGNMRGIVSVNGLIGVVYMQKNDLRLAKEHLQLALRKGQKFRHRSAYLTAAHTMANVYGISGEYDKAMALDEKALAICDSLDLDNIKTSFLDNKANCFLYTGKLDSAAFYFNECLKLDNASGDRRYIADTYSNLAHLETMRGNFASAEAYILRSFEMARDIKNSHNILKCHQILVKVYKDWGKKDLAIKAQDDYMTAYAKVMDEKKEQSLAEFKVVHETEKKEKIIAQNRIDLLEKEQEVRSRDSLIVIISLFAVFSGLILFLIYRQQKLKNRQQQQQHELKTAIARIETQNTLQEQRLSISRDLHDNIGSQLTFVISSVDNLRYAFDLKGSKIDEKLQHISQFTQATIIELRDTIWAMNHTEISFEDLRTRIYNFIEKARLARQDIAFAFEIDDSLGQLTFSSVRGMNIYRSIQEALNNAIKHSRATKVEVAIKRKGEDISILVQDNGSGFDVASLQDGNGLRNMKKRITDIGGTFDLKASGNGTAIEMIIVKQEL